MQKIIYALFILSLFFFSNCFSQNKSCKTGHCLKGEVGYLSFAIGPSIPLGNFADNKISNSNAGFANTGSKMELNAGFALVKSVDLGLKLFYSVNGYDVSALTNKLTAENPGVNWTTSGRTWDIYGGLIGFTYSHPLTKKFVSDFKIQSGLMHSSTPQMVITGSNGSKVTEDKKSASSFVYMLSAGGHYPVGRLIDVVGSLEYLGSSPTFNNINKFSNVTGYAPGTSTASFTQNISLLSFNFGFRVKF
jgi:hypothetical protein